MKHADSRNQRLSYGLLAVASLALSACDAFTSPETRIARADELMAQGEHRAAYIELKNALESMPDNVQARVRLAEASLFLGDVEGAHKELRRAIEAGATPAQVASLSAELRLTRGEFDELVTQLETGMLPLEDPDRSIVLGRALLGKQRFAEANDAFTRALKSDSGNLSARVGLAETLVAQGQLDAALSVLDEASTTNPEAPLPWLHRGLVLAQRGDYQLALAALQKAKPSAARKLDARHQGILLASMTETYLALGEVEQASNAQRELAALAPDWVLSKVLGARVLMAKRDLTAAIAELQKLIAATPRYTPGRFLLGAALLAQGGLNQAEQHLTIVVREAPDNLEARKLLAQVRLRLQRPEAAIEVLTPAVSAEGADSDIDALYGLAQLQRGNSQAALEHLERRVASEPGNDAFKYELASAYLQAQKPQAAIDLLNAAPHRADSVVRESLLLGAILRKDGVAAARAQINRWVEQYPSEPAFLNFAAEFFVRQSEFDRARALLSRAADAAPRHVNTLLNWARLEVANGKPSAAESWLEKALALDPTNARAQLHLAELAVQRDDTAAAREILEKMRKQDPQAVPPRVQLARIHLADGNLAAADAVADELIASAPGRADILNVIGSLYLDANRYEEALARFRAAESAEPKNATYSMNVARAQLALGHRGAARETLQRILRERPHWTPAVGAIVMLDMQEGRREGAAARVAKLRKEVPNDVGAMVLEGDLNMAMKQYDAAAEAFERAWKVRRDSPTAIKLYSARQRGRLGRATAPLEEWLARTPADMTVRAVLAEAYQENGQQSRAIEQYEIMIEQRDNVLALNNLAWLYYLSGDKRAIPTARRAYERAPTTPAVADTLGWILVETGEIQDGLAILEKAASAPDVDPEIEYHYAVALAKAGSHDQAKERLTKLLRQPRAFASADDARKLLDELAKS